MNEFNNVKETHFNPIEKWSEVLESEIGEKIPTTGYAILVGLALELQVIENRTSNRAPTEALPYQQYFLPMIRRLYSDICWFKSAQKETDNIVESNAQDDAMLNRAIFLASPETIHSMLKPIATFNLSSAIRKYKPFTAFGSAAQNLVQNQIMAFVVTEMRSRIIETGITPMWFLRAEPISIDGECYVHLMSE